MAAVPHATASVSCGTLVAGWLAARRGSSPRSRLEEAAQAAGGSVRAEGVWVIVSGPRADAAAQALEQEALRAAATSAKGSLPAGRCRGLRAPLLRTVEEQYGVAVELDRQSGALCVVGAEGPQAAAARDVLVDAAHGLPETPVPMPVPAVHWKPFLERSKEVAEAANRGGGEVVGLLSRWASAGVELDAVCIGTALYGARRTGHPLPPTVLLYLADQAAVWPRRFGSSAVGAALAGLCFAPDGPATRELLGALRKPLADCSSIGLSWRVAADMLFGLARQGESPAAAALLSELAPLLAAGRDDGAGQNVAMALYGLHQHQDSQHTRAVLRALASRLARRDPARGTPPAGLDVGHAFYGLQYQHSTAGRAVLALLAPWAASCPQPLGSGALSTAFSGLREFELSPEVCDVLDVLAAQAAASQEPFNGRDVSMALYGLRLLPPCPPVSRALSALLPRVASCPGPLLGSDIGLALGGLQHLGGLPVAQEIYNVLARLVRSGEGFSPDDIQESLCNLRGQTARDRALATVPVRRLLEGLAGRIENSKVRLSTRQFAMALYGLNAQEDCLAVRLVLAALLPCIDPAALPTATPRELTAGIYGLRLQGDAPLARSALAALLPFLREARSLAPMSVALAVYSLHGLPPVPEGRAVLCTLLPHMPHAVAVLPDRHVSMAAFGLQGQGSAPEAMAMLRLLEPRLLRLSNVGEHGKAHYAQAIQGLLALRAAGAPVDAVVHSLLERAPAAGPGVDALAQVLHLAGRGRPLPPSTESELPATYPELALRRLLQRAGVTGLRFNVHHPSGFELDVVCGTTYIELEGPGISYRSHGKQLIARLRDDYLRHHHGLTVVRIRTAGRPLEDVVGDMAQACGGAAGGASAAAAAAAWARARHLGRKGWRWALNEGRRDPAAVVKFPSPW